MAVHALIDGLHRLLLFLVRFHVSLALVLYNAFVPARFRQRDIGREIVLITGAGKSEAKRAHGIKVPGTLHEASYRPTYTSPPLVTPSSLPLQGIGGETVLITDAGSGLGRELAERFARLGCTLVLWDVNKAGNEETANQIRGEGGQVFTYTCDLCDRQKIYETAEKVRREVGEVDILVNIAGVVIGKPLLESDDKLIQRTMDVNVMAHFWTVKSFLPSMIKRNHGHIVTIASVAAFVCGTDLVDYCTSKSAVFGFNESLREELRVHGNDGVKTTCVCPSLITTGLFRGFKMRYESVVPFLSPEYAGAKIVEAVRTNQAVLLLPKTLYIMPVIKWMLPVNCWVALTRFLGADECMDSFTGRQKEN